MSFQVFYRKWRPQTLAEVVGQEPITETLRHAVKDNKVAHAYLFCGPRGTGKTSTGRILAKAVNCPNQSDGEPCNNCELCHEITEGRSLDVIEIDAASNRGIDDIRSLREKINYAPSLARYKVYIIDEVHMLTEYACNALLKTLEEPPPHAIFALATTEAHKVLPTIVSRCQRFDFHRLSQEAIEGKLNSICQKEESSVDANSLRLIAHAATGSLRDAENILQQLIAYHGNNISFEQTQMLLGTSSDYRVEQLARCVVRRDIPNGLRIINAVNCDGLDLRQFNQGLVESLRQLLLAKSGYADSLTLTAEDRTETTRLAGEVTLDYLLRATRIFSNVDFRSDNYSPLPLELALIDSVLSTREKRAETVAIETAEARNNLAPGEASDQFPQGTTSPALTDEAESHVNATISSETPAQVQDFDHLCSHWTEFVQSLRGSGSIAKLGALLRSSCKPVALEDDTLVLEFYASFHKEQVEEARYRHMLEKRFEEVFGKPYKIKCTLTEHKKGVTSRDKEQNPLIKAAIDMGAKIVD